MATNKLFSNSRIGLASIVLLLMLQLLANQPTVRADTQDPATTTSELEAIRPEPVKLPERDVPPPPAARDGYIELHLPNSYVDIWSEVQWRDGAGVWHPVTGWRGFTDHHAQVRWNVRANDFKKGPFRWQIFLFEEGDFLGSSEPFFLPKASETTVLIDLQLPDLEQLLNEAIEP